MNLGIFSISLSVKNLQASREFYERLGFEVLHDATAQNYLILKNGRSVIGLFHGMFDGQILTFNPGWDENGQNVDPFDDVRAIQQRIKADGLTPVQEADESTTGPASCILTDPDGNTILIDQHR